MPLVRITRAFDWIGPSRYCVLCKLATWAFKPRAEPVEAPEEAIAALEAAGAGERVDDTPEPRKVKGRRHG